MDLFLSHLLLFLISKFPLDSGEEMQKEAEEAGTLLGQDALDPPVGQGRLVSFCDTFWV